MNAFLVFPCTFLQGQFYKDTNPLQKFFLDNYDSTIIYHQWSSWHPFPNYYIVAKKGNWINYFTYTSPYHKALGRYYPEDLTEKFIQEDIKFQSTTPDTNRYFLPVYIHHSKRDLIWTATNGYDIWRIQEVNENNYSCEVYDATSDTYYLITKQGIRILNFYAADFFEKCKPGNINLLNAIKTRDTILKAFGEQSRN